MSRRRRADDIRTCRCTCSSCVFTLFTLYPVLWVVTMAFSGRQNLAIATLPPDPTVLDRLRAITAAGPSSGPRRPTSSRS